MLRMTLHGGQCCGMKQIFGFRPGGGTQHKEPAYVSYPNVTKVPKKYVDNGNVYTVVVNDALRFSEFIEPELTEARLDRFLNASEQSNGIIEIILAEGRHPWTDQSEWVSVIEERGFVEVSQCYNSNSANIIHVYHLVKDTKQRLGL